MVQTLSISPVLTFLGRLAGPILDKELRVSSRRKRSYLLRSVYVGLLAVFVGFVWVGSIDIFSGNTSAAYTASQMAEAGQAVTGMVLWFQFVCSMLLAAVFLSVGINEEIRKRTLDVLLTTHVNCFHIVAGKLVGKLLQILVLVAISMPLLAVVRVLGGVRWDCVVAGVAITATGTVFVGTLSLFLSIYVQQGYRVIMTVVFVCIVLFMGVPGALAALRHYNAVSGATADAIVYFTNPFVAMFDATQSLFGAVTPVAAGRSWPAHCGVMLACAGALMALTMVGVRRAALSGSGLMVRRIGTAAGDAIDRIAARASGTTAQARQTSIQIKGSPIIWREMQGRLSRHRATAVVRYGLVAIAIITASVAAVVINEEAQMVIGAVAWILSFLLVIRVGAQAASCVTKEKEARTWPILLSTPVSDGQIVKHKMIAVLLRNLPTIIVIFGLYSIIYLYAIAHEPAIIIALIGAPVGFAASMTYVMGLGIYLSMRMKSSTGAVAATLGIYLGTSYFCCGCTGPMIGVFGFGGPAGVGLMATLIPVVIQLIPAVVWAGVGIIFARLAVGRVRTGQI